MRTTTKDHCRAVGGMLAGYAKRILSEGLELQPAAFLVKHGLPFGMIAIDTAPEVRESLLRQLRELARSNDIDAIITANDMYLKFGEAPTEQAALDAIAQCGDLAEDIEARECLVVCIKGPRIGQMMLITPYIRNDVGDIEYQPTLELDEPLAFLGINIIPDWWIE